MDTTESRAWVTIDLQALKKNLGAVKSQCAESRIVPVIKANGYGHGMEQVARALCGSSTKLAGLAVATIDEALELARLELGVPIVLLPGFRNDEELTEILRLGIEPVVHALWQVTSLQQHFDADFFAGHRRIWIKHNSGMNRLGMSSGACLEAFPALHRYPDTEIVLMSHLACADDPDDARAKAATHKQLADFNGVRQRLMQVTDAAVNCSFAASAGVLCWPATHYQYVRPGIMLYGGSPLASATGEELGLHPVMTLKARVLAINDVKAGAAIGYGARHVCAHNTRVGVVGIGYGDGYPRAAVDGTPVLVHAGGKTHRTRLIGRVSMDMITVDLTPIESAQIGDEVTLWGEGLSADEVARNSGTISYELFCQITNRVRREYR
jgi:alanine racemase